MLGNFKRALVVVTGLMIFSSLSYALTPTNPQDPYENLNRHTFMMNDTLDRAILKPVAKGYNAVVPSVARTGIGNFFDNLSQIPTVINDLLQGQFSYAAADTTRFLVNSTLGVGGLIDIAKYMSMPMHSNDLGMTFAKWGYKSSNYYVIPILGPSTVRDTVGLFTNYEFFTVYPYVWPRSLRYGLLALDGLRQRASYLEFEGVIQQASIDPYAFQRDAYLQHRAYQIAQNDNR